MNALLLITNLEEADLDDLYADIKVYQGGECVQMSYGNPLIKVPKVKLESLDELRYYGATPRDIRSYMFGFDDCLEQILGEQE